MKKKIGLVGDAKSNRRGNYCAAIEACQAEMVFLESAETEVIRQLGGIVIMGGVDINPSLYHEENIDSRNVDDGLDALELTVIREALRWEKPILGICRGHQMINVFFGGSLIQNVEHWEEHMPAGPRDNVHSTRANTGSFIDQIYKAETLPVNSAHHQAVKQLGAGLKAVQFCEDGTIEAICHTELPVFGVQWHPERICLKNSRPGTVDGLELFQYFIGQC